MRVVGAALMDFLGFSTRRFRDTIGRLVLFNRQFKGRNGNTQRPAIKRREFRRTAFLRDYGFNFGRYRYYASTVLTIGLCTYFTRFNFRPFTIKGGRYYNMIKLIIMRRCLISTNEIFCGNFFGAFKTMLFAVQTCRRALRASRCMR